MGAQNVKSGSVLVLHKTLDLLEAIQQSRSGVRLTELAGKLGMPKPTAHRILTTLEGRGYLDRNEDGEYRLSRRLTFAQTDGSLEERLRASALPVMQKLVNACKETVNLGIMDSGEVIVIETIESPQAVRMSSKVGNRRFLHSTALGKVMLSDMQEKDILRLVRMKGMPQMTPNTITTEKELLAELRLIRQQGFALDNQEHEPDGRCIGGPIRGRDGRVIGGLSISGPIHRMTKTNAKGLLGHLLSACREIESSLAT
jgi:IclR family transcriptional regulator, KDG regulon repressor